MKDELKIKKNIKKKEKNWTKVIKKIAIIRAIIE